MGKAPFSGQLLGFKVARTPKMMGDGIVRAICHWDSRSALLRLQPSCKTGCFKPNDHELPLANTCLRFIDIGSYQFIVKNLQKAKRL